MSTEHDKVRLSDAIESLTGFERIALEDHFGRDLSDLSSTRMVVGVIAMLMKREGMDARDAWNHAKTLGLKATSDYFLDEPEENVVDIDGDGPDAGKGGNGDGTPPTHGSASPSDPSPSISTSRTRKAS